VATQTDATYGHMMQICGAIVARRESRREPTVASCHSLVVRCYPSRATAQRRRRLGCSFWR